MFKKNKFILLLQQGDVKMRDAVYAGISMVIADYLVKEGKSLVNIKREARELTYELSELAIVEKDRLFGCVNKAISAKYNAINRFKNANYGGCSSAEDIMPMNKYLAKGVIDNINNNIDLFNSATINCYYWIKENMEE